MSTQLAQALQLDVEHWKKLGDNAERDGDWSVADVYRVCADQLREALAAFEAAPQQAQAPFTHAVATTTNGRPGITIYDLGPSLNPDSAITAKLIEMGWTPPSKQAQEPGWQDIATAPRQQGVPIMVSWPVHELDDEDMPTGPILRRVTLITEMNGSHWLDPDVCNASGAWFGDEYAYAEQPDLWQPLPPAPQQGSATE